MLDLLKLYKLEVFYNHVNFGDFISFLSLIINKSTTVIPDIKRPVSSRIPKFNAAENPNNDHIKGIINKYFDTGLSVHKSNPKVKIVVGQGSPNVGD